MTLDPNSAEIIAQLQRTSDWYRDHPRIDAQGPRPCPECDGEGLIDDRSWGCGVGRCENCNGTGEVE